MMEVESMTQLKLAGHVSHALTSEVHRDASPTTIDIDHLQHRRHPGKDILRRKCETPSHNASRHSRQPIQDSSFGSPPAYGPNCTLHRSHQTLAHSNTLISRAGGLITFSADYS